MASFRKAKRVVPLLAAAFIGARQISVASTAEGKGLLSKRVVVVGGGYGGATFAQMVKGKCQLTVIDPKEGLHHNMGALRACVEPGFAKKTFIPYEPTFGDGFKRGEVKSINVQDKVVTMQSGQRYESVPYDYLVIATGSTGKFPCKVTKSVDNKDIISKFDSLKEEIHASTKIVIVGGGAAGVELAGEIMTDLKGKEVYLIHPREKLVSEMNADSFTKSVRDQLETLGVKLVLGERVTNLEELPTAAEKSVVRTDKGSSIEADLVVPCTGLKVNTSAYGISLANKMDGNGYLNVNETLQVDGCDGVFAIGDCNNKERAKLAHVAETQAKYLAKNIETIDSGKQVQPYKPGGMMMALSIGREGGALQNGTWVLGAFFARFVKSKDVFTKQTWGTMKQTPPKE
ncbi:apoptosis-inducing factor 2-like [Anneissia japonica]|uniref:apoptosis-inducing factor 2-like n=1 Tax=Anneissia japonica TaxID=1529436 RepID=UPI001425B4E4|nr:apoptosis-inducing factor 2-like [Anneissia japonica]